MACGQSALACHAAIPPMRDPKPHCHGHSRGVRPAFLGLHAAEPQRYRVLFESSAPHATAGRYDILLAGPGATVTGNAFLTALEGCWQRERQAPAQRDVPFCGGWFIYLGYE